MEWSQTNLFNMNNFRYTLDEFGYPMKFGYMVACGQEISDEEPFKGFDIVRWRKDLETGQWVYLPDVTPVNKEIVNVKYDWQQMKAHITIADQFNPGPHEFDCTTTWTDQDCIDAINSKFK